MIRKIALLGAVVLALTACTAQPKKTETPVVKIQKETNVVTQAAVKAKKKVETAKYESLSLLPKDYVEPLIAGGEDVDLSKGNIKIVYPIKTKPGLLTIVYGSNFGDKPGIIKVGDITISKYLYWSNDTIYLRMPEGVRDGDKFSIGGNIFAEKLMIVPDNSIKVVVQIDSQKAQECIDGAYEKYGLAEPVKLQFPLSIKGQWIKNGEKFGDYESGWDGGRTVPMFMYPGTSICCAEMYFTEKNFELFKKKIVYFAIEDSDSEENILSPFESDGSYVIKREWGGSDDIEDSDTDPGFKVSLKSKNYIEKENTVYAVFPNPDYKMPKVEKKTAKEVLAYDVKSVSAKAVGDKVAVNIDIDKFEAGDMINLYSKLNKRQAELITTVAINTKDIMVNIKPLLKTSIIAKIVSKNGAESAGKTSETIVAGTKNVVYDNLDGREMFIYLPEGYDTNNSEKYPVMYMFDGQALFSTDYTPNEWKIDETCDTLIKDGKINKTIVVGIWNGKRMRGFEYNPYMSDIGKAHGEFIVSKIIPYIESKYSVKTGRENRGISGSSLGGLMALYMCHKYPDYFSFFGAFSTYDPWGLETLKSAPKSQSKIWVDAGTNENASDGVNFYGYANQARNITDVLLNKGYAYGKELFFMEAKNAIHNEADWAVRVGNAFIIFQGTKEGNISDVEISAERFSKNDESLALTVNPIVTLDNGLKFSAYKGAEYSAVNGEIDNSGIFKMKDSSIEVKVKYGNFEKTRIIESKDVE